MLSRTYARDIPRIAASTVHLFQYTRHVEFLTGENVQFCDSAREFRLCVEAFAFGPRPLSHDRTPCMVLELSLYGGDAAGG